MPEAEVITDRLARIEVKLDMLMEQRSDHEGRITRLEKVAWVAIGLAVASGAPWAAQLLG